MVVIICLQKEVKDQEVKEKGITAEESDAKCVLIIQSQ